MTRGGAIKWNNEIRAFQDGKVIQGRWYDNNEWEDIDYPEFNEDYSYRIKPEKKIDVASEHIITEIAKLLHDGDEVNVTFVRETLKDVYGDE